MKTKEYFENLHQCLSGSEAWDANGKPVALDRAFQTVIDWIGEVQKRRAKVIFVGNGGSAAIASHQAVDLWKNGGIRAVAFNDAALLTCVSNDYSYPEVFEKPIAMFADPADVLIAISSSGKSPNILKAVEKAKAIGCRVVTMSGFKPGNPLRRSGPLNFYVPSDSYGMVEIAHLTLCHYITDHFVSCALKASKK